MKWNCLDKDGNLLGIVSAESQQEALSKAPSGTVSVEEREELDYHGLMR